ncbi:hypothetical protein FGO68_gene11929 [Halteria grandinella]|uniref:Uncharacterized protein n=1 Tax=Halteria grandinella TaxID=5974 RepID=A0A8J8P3J1_HALGN|nr:hypothetical protein FGO68_gene11929 [Halteria grandinella]
MTVNGLAFTPTINTCSSSSITVTDYSSSLPATSPIIQNQFEGQYSSSCSINSALAPNDYTDVSSTQQAKTFILAIESTSLTIAITRFTASKLFVSGADPVFTYQLDTYYQPPNGVTVNPVTGDIAVSPVSALGAIPQQVVIEGKLQDCQTINAKFIIIGEPNTAPQFQGIAGSTLPDVAIVQGDVASHQFPHIIDPNAAQSIVIALIDGGRNAYPRFIDFADSSHMVVTISPITSTPVGSYPVQVQLNDGITTTLYNMNIMILEVNSTSKFQMNLGPPIFTQMLEAVNLKIGNIATYALPQQQDPDEEDQISIDVQLKEAICFAQYDKAAKLFIFKPERGIEFSNSYNISIILADNNINPKSRLYKLEIKIELEQDQSSNETEVLNTKNIKTYKSGIRIVKISRSGQLQLKITSSQNYIAEAIANTLKESQLKVFVPEKSQISAKIENLQEENILSIKLDFKNREKISAGMVSDLINLVIRNWTIYKQKS